MPCAFAFIPLRGNRATKPYREYLDCMVGEDIHFHAYVDHRETHLFYEFVFYSGWLACGSRLMYPHLPERVMRQFDYMHFLPKDPYEYALPAMTHRDTGVIYDDYLNHLILNGA